MQETGINETQAKQAVEVTVRFVKARVPAAYAGMIDGLIEGKINGDDLSSAIGLFSGFFGKK